MLKNSNLDQSENAMCYSNSSTSTNVHLAERYKKKIPPQLDETPIFYASGFTYPTWRIITSNEEIQPMRWGLIPFWFTGKDWKDIASITLNSRIETADEKASFKHLIERQRCIVPSNGFYEFKTVGKEKVPYFVFPRNEELFSMAGLYDKWHDPIKGDILHTFSILTCDANPLMREIHNSKFRMPVILKNEVESDWLGGQLDHKTLITPFPDTLMDAREISKKLINTGSNSPEIQKPFNNGIYEQGSLF